MIGYLRTCVRKQPIIALYFEFETVFEPRGLNMRLLLLLAIASFNLVKIMLVGGCAITRNKFSIKADTFL